MGRTFRHFPLVQLIDLDAAMGTGCKFKLHRIFCKETSLPGGRRNSFTGSSPPNLAARCATSDPRISAHSGRKDQHRSGRNSSPQNSGDGKLVFGIDAKGGKIAIRGWREITSISPLEMIQALDPFCSAFLYTHIDTEGLMTGLPLEAIRPLRRATSKQLIVAGGIATSAEVEHLHTMGIDAVVGMALYSGRMSLPVTIPISK